MNTNNYGYFVHPESEDLIVVSWYPNSWEGYAKKYLNGIIPAVQNGKIETFEVTLKELTKNNWIKIQPPSFKL